MAIVTFFWCPLFSSGPTRIKNLPMRYNNIHYNTESSQYLQESGCTTVLKIILALHILHLNLLCSNAGRLGCYINVWCYEGLFVLLLQMNTPL